VNNPYPIRLYGDAVLRRRAAPVTVFDERLREFADALATTMLHADGAGLAAPQVGVSLRIFTLAGTYAGVLDPEVDHDEATQRAAVRTFINPQLIAHAGARVDLEGCLSIPGVYAEVERAAQVTLRYQDLTGAEQQLVADGLMAKAVQHELDHLEGVLFLDRLPERQRRDVMEEHRSELAQLQRDARAHLKALSAANEPLQPWP
jgi:peptide deformylase